MAACAVRVGARSASTPTPHASKMFVLCVLQMAHSALMWQEEAAEQQPGKLAKKVA